MRTKFICKVDELEAVKAIPVQSDKALRAALAALPPGEYAIFTLLREKVTVSEVPSRTRVDFGPATATRSRGPRKG